MPPWIRNGSRFVDRGRSRNPESFWNLAGIRAVCVMPLDPGRRVGQFTDLRRRLQRAGNTDEPRHATAGTRRREGCGRRLLSSGWCGWHRRWSGPSRSGESSCWIWAWADPSSARVGPDRPTASLFGLHDGGVLRREHRPRLGVDGGNRHGFRLDSGRSPEWAANCDYRRLGPLSTTRDFRPAVSCWRPQRSASHGWAALAPRGNSSPHGGAPLSPRRRKPPSPQPDRACTRRGWDYRAKTAEESGD